MPYVTSIERMAREEGREEGRAEGRAEGQREGLQQGIEITLELKFGEAGAELLPLVQAEQRVNVLRAVQRAIHTAETLGEVPHCCNRRGVGAGPYFRKSTRGSNPGGR